MEGPRSSTGSTRTRGALIAILGVLFFGAIAGVAQAVPLSGSDSPLPGSNFQAGDGDQLTEAPYIDWQTATGVIRRGDPQANDNIFAGGTKESDPDSWTFATKDGGSTPEQSNVLDAYVKSDPVSGDSFLYVAFTREAQSGTTYLAYELNQRADSWVNSAGATIPCRTTGDIIVSLQVSGNTPDLILQKWTTVTADATTGCAKTGTLTDFTNFTDNVDAQGAVNLAPITNYLPASFTWPGNTIGTKQFTEAGLNLTTLLEGVLGNPCFNFGSLWVHTRSSTEDSSQLQDYIAPQPLIVRNCTASGTKFHDLNANGVKDAGEPGLAGWRIWADYNQDGIRDEGANAEPFAITDADGNYTITNIKDPSGTYNLREQLPAGGTGGWICSYPATTATGGDFPCAHKDINGATTPNVSGKDFGNYKNATVIVKKETVPAGAAGSFDFTSTITGKPSFSLSDGQQNSTSVTPGTYTATESGHPNFDLTDITCSGDTIAPNSSDSGSTATFNAQSGETITCVFTNTEKPGDVGITKVADHATVTAGEDIGFTLTISNAGPGIAHGVTVSDTLPANAGLSWTIDGGTGAADCAIASGKLTCDFGDMAAGASLTVHIKSPTTAASCAKIDNTGKVDSTNGGSGEDSDSVTVQCPDLVITKVADKGTVSAGDPIGFTITVKNNGPGVAKNVTLSDTLPSGFAWGESPDNPDCSISGGTLTCAFGDLADDASASVHITATTTAADCGAVKNTATADADNDDPVSGDDTVTIQCPDLVITKMADKGTVSAGDPIGFTITVKNNGPGVAKNVTLNDSLPSGFTWSEDPDNPDCSISAGTLSCAFGDLADDASASVHITATTTAANCGAVKNTATADADNDDPVSDDDTVTIQCPDIAITKIADDAIVDAGEDIGFTITVKNNGPGTAHDVTLSDPLPSTPGLSWTEEPDNEDCEIASGTLECDFGDLGDDATRTVHISSPTTAASCATIDNTATVSASNDASESDDDSVTVQCGAVVIDKVADDESVDAGDDIGFTITVTNTGAGSLHDVTVTDDLPSGFGWSIDPANGACEIESGTLTCDFGTLASGDDAFVHITAPTTAEDCGSVPNTAKVSTDVGDDDDTDTTRVDCPEIDVEKSGPAQVEHGGTLTFTFAVTNPGDVPLHDVTVVDDHCSPLSAPVKTGGNQDDVLDLTETWTYTCTMPVPAHAADEENPIHNEATATGKSPHDTTVEDKDTHDTTIVHPAIHVEKTGPAEAYHGDQVTFTYAVTNAGDVALHGITVADDKCPNATLKSKTGGNQDDNLDLQETWTYTCTMTIPAHQAGEQNPLHNTVTATGTSPGGTPVTDQDSHDTKLNHPAIDIEKTGPATATAGDVLSYTLTVTNPGDMSFASDKVVVTDPGCDDQPTLTSVNGDATPGSLDPKVDTWTYVCSHATAANVALTYPNTATVTGTDKNGRTVTDNDTIETVVNAGGTEPEEIVHGTARLRGPSGCVRKTFTATVRGSRIAQVTFFVDGERVKRLTAPNGEGSKFTFKVNPKGRGFGVHRVTAKVVFNSASETKTRTLRLSFQRCRKQVVEPRFTG